MQYGRYGWSYFFLRVGLGITFLWIGLDMFRNPEVWIGYLPTAIPLGLGRESALQFNAILDVVIGIFLLVRVLPKITALLAALHFLGILVVQGIDAVLIRDIGLLGAALALLAWPTYYHKKKWWQRYFKWGQSGNGEE